MIERIIIENFKSIRKLDLELKPINILVGANGVGKSNFISFFKLINHIYERRLQWYIAKNDIDKLLYFGRKRSNRLGGAIIYESNVGKDFIIYPSESSNRGTLFANEYTNFKDDERKPLCQAAEEAEIGIGFENFREKDLKIYHFHDTGSSSPLKQINALNDNRNLRENGENLAAFLYYLQEKQPKDFQNIENQIRSVAPFFERFDLAPDRLNEKQIELRWLEKSSDAYFNAYDLSDGTLRFMALTTLLLQPDLPKTIIIDEPELGLHPFAINKLAAMMKQAAAKGSQVIVSTQSVGLIDNFEPEDIITVDREDNQSVFKRLDSKELEGWLEDYTLGELWNKNIIGAMP
jgi:predicted ATPase